MKQKYPQFGTLLSNLRIQAGIKQQSELAKLVGVTQQTVSRWESGASRPKSDQILKLADLLKTDPQPLLAAAGYTKTQHESHAILSFDKPFPFMSLTPDSFERFCCDLLIKTYPNASVHLWGGAGHKQNGIDIKIDYPDGTVETYQCKRESEFGSQKVKEAIEYQTIPADKKYIMLARVASPQARQEAIRHEGWDILDQEDLSRMVRDLSKHEQKYLVDTYFFGQRMALIGEAEPGIWRDSSTHYAPLMNPSTPLNHTLSLVGRHNEAQRLYNVCINAGSENENTKRIIYLAGAAGIGKSRLLKYIIDKIEAEQREIRVWFWDGISTITSKDLESLGQGRKLLVVDGCPKVEALIPLFDFVFRNQNTTLIVATRFDEFDRIKSEAVDVGILGSMVEEIRLNALSELETTKIALEILRLNKGNENMAQHIAKWTTDSPLVTVLSTHLALKENVSFAQVRAHKDYTSIIKGKFSKVLVGEIGQKSDQIPIQQILKVLALVQPFEIHDTGLIECIASIERLESFTIKRLLRVLVEAGVLWKNQSDEYRLSPEVLSDLILEEVCLGAEEKSTGYADILYDTLDKCAPHCIRNLIYNLGRFEWGKNMHNTTTEKIELIDTIWNKLNDTNEDIEIVERIAYYQPKKTLEFVKKVLMSRLASSRWDDSFIETNVSQTQDLEVYDKHSPEYLNKMGDLTVNEIDQYFRVTMYPKAIFDDLTPIIQTVALHKDFLAQACDLLWQMSKYYDASSQSLSANYNHPIRILKEIFSYKPDKLQDYLIVAVDWAINLLKNYNPEDYTASPFEFLSEVMKTEGTTMETSADSITTGFTNNNYEFVAPLRNKLIEACLKMLVSTDTKKSYSAAEFLASCLTYSNKDNCVWTEEAMNTLETLKNVVKNEKIQDYALIYLSLEIDQLLLQDSSAITNLLSDIKTQIHKTIRKDKELCISAVMMGKWDWLESKDRTHVKTYGDIINSIFDKSTMNLNASYDLINSKYQEISLVDKDIQSKFKRFFSALCETNLDFSKYSVEQALNPKTNDNLWQFAWIPLSMLLHYERSNGQAYAAKLLKSSDNWQRELVGQAYGNLSINEYQLDDVDNDSIIQIITDSDESVILSGLIFIKNRVFRDGNFLEALDWLILIRKDVSQKIIGEMFEIIRHTPLNFYTAEEIQQSKERLLANQDVIKNFSGDPTVSTLKTKEQVQETFPEKFFKELCKYLIPLDKIPFSFNDGIEAFILHLTAVYPEVVLELVLKRAEYAIENKLLEHTFFSQYQIIDEQFLTRNTSGVFLTAHNGIRSSIGFVKQLRKIPKVESVVNQWLEQHKNDTQGYERVRSFLRTWVLSVSTRDPKADKLMNTESQHIFKNARDFIRQELRPSIFFTHTEVDNKMKELYELINAAFIETDLIEEKRLRNFARNEWRESRELQIFKEEIKPIYDVFKGYQNAYQHTFEFTKGVCSDLQTTIIPRHSADGSKIQYCLQISPFTENNKTLRVSKRVAFSGTRAQYDGQIEFLDESCQNIEVTVANKSNEQGTIKNKMHQDGYAVNPMNDTAKIRDAFFKAIDKKLNDDKHIGKYTNCWLIVVLNGLQFESVEDLEGFLHFFGKALQKDKCSINWTKIKSIIIYPGN